MKMRRILALLPPAICGSAALMLSFSRGPLPKLTGGFGEETCINCHNSYPLNAGRALGGIFQIEGAPKEYVSGATYPLTVLIGQPGQSRWGFELSARFAATGKQAGRLVPADEKTQVLETGGIQYIEHTLVGTRGGTADGPVQFQVNWVAPDPSGGRVIFNAAGNAADSSDSVVGDFIYTAGAWSGSGGEAPRMTATTTEAKKKWGDRINDSSRLVDLPIPAHLRKGAFEIHIQHRFFEGLPDSKPGDAFGIDSGANINLSVNYGITNRLSMGVSRARFDEIIAWTGTYELQTRKDSFWKMSLLGGVEGKNNFQRHYSPFLQLSTSLDYRGLRLYAVPTAVFHSRNLDLVEAFPGEAINPDSKNTLAMGLGADLAINSKLSLVGEIVPRLAGYGGIDSHRPTMSAGFEMRSWGHVFTILVSSSRDFTPGTYAVNPEQREVSLGFNIYRRIR